VLATALATIATFQVVLLRKNDEPFRCFVKILRFQFAGHSSCSFIGAQIKGFW
jgi:hypothetical protein